MLTSIKRAGADIILTYHAKDCRPEGELRHAWRSRRSSSQRAKARDPRRREARCAPSGPSAASRPSSPRAKGRRVYDVDGNAYVDYVGSWGPLILGHAHPRSLRGDRGARPRAAPLRRADRARGRARRARSRRCGPVDRDGPLRHLGHRGDDERAARGARLHRPRQGRQVRRLLPRPRRHAARRGRLRRRDPRHPRLAGRPRARWPTR